MKIWKLKVDNIKEYREKVIANHQTLNGKNGNEKWKTTQAVLLKAAEEVCGRTRVGNTKREKRGGGVTQFKT